MVRSTTFESVSGPVPQDIAARRVLRRMRRVAGGLLVGMAGVTALGYGLPAFGLVADNAWLSLLRAGARAGVVGGIADWFAVTALFRHPLGVPIPHTAILPRQKNRLGQALGRFVAGQFFTEEDVGRALAAAGLPDIVARSLRDPRTVATVSQALRSALPEMFERLEDGRAAAAISGVLPSLVGGDDLAPIVVKGLRALVDGDRHQEVLSFLLLRVKIMVREKESSLRTMIEDRVREQGGRMLGWAIGGSIASKVLTALNQELERIDPQDSELREGFSAWIREEVDRIEHDPERRADIAEAVGGVLTHDSLKAWSQDVWRRARGLAEADCERPDGWTACAVEAMLLRFSEQVAHDQALRAKIEHGALTLIGAMLPAIREKLTGFIASVVSRWDAVALTEKLELRVGRDLQFIRINGTVVGFIVGVVLEAVLRLCFGQIR